MTKLLVIGVNEAKPQHLQLADLRCVGDVCRPYFTQTIYKFPDRLVGGSDSALVSSSTAADLKCNRNPAIDVAGDCLAAPHQIVEADSAAPWQRASTLDHVEVAAVRAA